MAMFDSVWHLKELSMGRNLGNRKRVSVCASSIGAIAIDASAGDTRTARRLSLANVITVNVNHALSF